MADHDTEHDPRQQDTDGETAPPDPLLPDGSEVERPRPRTKRPRRQPARATGTRISRRGEGVIIPLNMARGGSTGAEPEQPEPEREPEEDADVLGELEQRGFTTDEAIRLVHASARIATSKEAREAEATLRRLRFTRWLVEQGMLDEFSA
jgi:hypothetical protein